MATDGYQQSSNVQTDPAEHDSSDAEIKEATVGFVADFKTLQQLSSSSAAAKAKRAGNILDRVLENTFLDAQEQKEDPANQAEEKKSD